MLGDDLLRHLADALLDLFGGVENVHGVIICYTREVNKCADGDRYELLG